jgi:hypothetical protein
MASAQTEMLSTKIVQPNSFKPLTHATNSTQPDKIDKETKESSG